MKHYRSGNWGPDQDPCSQKQNKWQKHILIYPNNTNYHEIWQNISKENTSFLHDKYIIVSADKAPNNIVFVCKSHYIDCLIKELGIDNSLGNPTYTPGHLRKRKSWTIVGLFYVPLEFQPNMKHWIYHHSTGFLNYKVSFQTALYCLVCQMLHETSFQIINMYSIGSENRASELLRH